MQATMMYKAEALVDPVKGKKRAPDARTRYERWEEQLKGVTQKLAGHVPENKKASLEFQRDHLLELMGRNMHGVRN